LQSFKSVGLAENCELSSASYRKPIDPVETVADRKVLTSLEDKWGEKNQHTGSHPAGNHFLSKLAHTSHCDSPYRNKKRI
jgi:hypothetical protein